MQAIPPADPNLFTNTITNQATTKRWGGGGEYCQMKSQAGKYRTTRWIPLLTTSCPLGPVKKSSLARPDREVESLHWGTDTAVALKRTKTGTVGVPVDIFWSLSMGLSFSH